jgi:hypothetical protein
MRIDERHLLLGRQAAQLGRGGVAEQPVEHGRRGSRSKRSTSSIPRWLVAITTGRARGARVLAQPDLHLEVVALVDEHVGARGEVGDRGVLDPAGKATTRTYGSSSATSRAASTTLLTPTSADAARDAVEVRELERVEVGQPQLAADALVRQGRHDRAPTDRPATATHSPPSRALLTR